MIFPDVELTSWLKKFPHFKGPLNDLCEDYDLNLNLAVPFITKEKVGVLVNPDEPGRPITVNSFRSPNINKELTEIVTGILKS